VSCCQVTDRVLLTQQRILVAMEMCLPAVPLLSSLILASIIEAADVSPHDTGYIYQT
jgi:hypothetical protein